MKYNPIKEKCSCVDTDIDNLKKANNPTMKKARARQLLRSLAWVQFACVNAAKYNPAHLDF
jgi:hypothetical protein